MNPILLVLAMLLFLVVGVSIAASFAWPKIKELLGSKAIAAPARNADNPTLIMNGNEYDITPAAPCPANHGCKFVVAPAEKCLLTEAEKAVQTLGEFAPRAKAISRKVRGTLQQSFDFGGVDAPEVTA